MFDSSPPPYGPWRGPGSSFVDLLRDVAPESLPASGLDTPHGPAGALDVVHGTTVLAIRYDTGVVMAGDRRATMGYTIANRRVEKVFAADEFSGVAIAGAAGPAVELVKLFQVQLEHYENIEGELLSLEGKANQLGQLVRANLPAAERVALEELRNRRSEFKLSPKQTRVRAAVRRLEFDVLRYLRHEAARDGNFEPEHLELEFKDVAIDGVSVRGRIDRVDVHDGHRARLAGVAAASRRRLAGALRQPARDLGAAPEPVPPPMPAVMNTMSESLSASKIFSASSSAARWPMPGSPPAPSPRVILSPMRIL